MPNPFVQRSNERMAQRAYEEEQQRIQSQPYQGNYLLDLGASAVSAIPEMVGAEPWERAQAFRTANPIMGTVSEFAGLLVPYLGAEAAVAKIPGLAARVAAGTGHATRGMEALGFRGAGESLVARGLAREAIVNAPVELGRVAVGALAYPEELEQTAWNAGVDLSLASGIGAGFGWLAKGAKSKGKAPKIEGVEDFTASTWKLNALEKGALVEGAEKEILANQLEREALEDNPGKTGIRGKKIPYVLPIQGLSIEQTDALNSLFKPGKDEVKLSAAALEEGPPIVKFENQYFIENPSASKGKRKYLQPGKLDEVLEQLPPAFRTARDIASNIQYARLGTVHNTDGARELAGKLSNNGMIGVGQTAMVQERNGLWIVAHKIKEGTGRKFGKGPAQVRAGDEWLFGKMMDPGLLEPQAAAFRDQVTAPWAKQIAAVQPERNKNMFSDADDAFLDAVTKTDMERLSGMRTKQEKVNYLSEKFGKMKAETMGLLDNKFNFADSQSVKDLAESVLISLAPTSHLRRANREYDRLFGLMQNGQRTAEALVRKIVYGEKKLGAGRASARAVLGAGKKGVEATGWKGHATYEDLVFNKGMTDEEANVIIHLANANVLTKARADKLVKDGTISQGTADIIEEMRLINEDVVNEFIPVLDEAGQTVEWLKNHLGIPMVPRGSMFVEVKGQGGAGKLKHIAWGKSAAEAEREAKLIVEEAKANGKDWGYDKAQMRDLPGQTEQQMADLQKNVANTIGRSAEDGEVIYKAMRRLASIKATTGRNPTVPITSGVIKKRKGVTASEEALSSGATKYSRSDLMDALHGHLSQLSKFTAMQNWQSRFGNVAKDALKGHDPKLYEDLNLKGRQYLGIASDFSRMLDKKLSKVMPGSMGNRPATAIAAAVNESIFGLTLGFANLSHAILNLLSPIQTVMPWIMHMAVLPRQEMADLMGHTVTMNGKGQLRGLSAFVEPIKVMSSAIRLLGVPPADLKELIDRALDDGVFHPQLFEDWVGAGSKNRMGLIESFKKGGVVDFIRKLGTLAGEESEKLSRLVAWNSAYRVGKDLAGLSGDELYRFMRRSQEMTMFAYHTVDRSNLFTGQIGSMFGLFKNWQMHFIGNMMQYAGLAINKGQFGPLVWAGGSAVALGGLGATPLIQLADGLGEWENEANSSYLWMMQNYSDKLADGLYFGLPAFLGVSLQASSTLPGTDVRNEVNSLFSFAMLNRASMLWKAVGEGWEYHQATGANPFSDPNVRDMFVAAAAPRLFIRAMSTTEDDYIRSMGTGYPQAREISPVGRMLHRAGMNIVEVERYQEASQELYAHEQKMNTMVRSLGRNYYNAMREDDYREMDRIVNQAIAMSVPLDKVARSAMTIQKREEQGDLLSRYSLSAQAEARSAVAYEPEPEEE